MKKIFLNRNKSNGLNYLLYFRALHIKNNSKTIFLPKIKEKNVVKLNRKILKVYQ